MVNATPWQFYPGNDPVHIVQDLGQVGTGEVNSTVPAFDLQTVQPVSSRYAFYLIPSHVNGLGIHLLQIYSEALFVFRRLPYPSSLINTRIQNWFRDPQE